MLRTHSTHSNWMRSALCLVGRSLLPARHACPLRMTPFSDGLLVADAVSAWSVNGATLTSTDAAASLFGASLFPYLALLFFLSRPETATPRVANFGFQFLLVFVFATIPAGIYAKVQYHDILANVDWLHGAAESFLTLTNLFIIAGFRSTRVRPSSDTDAQTQGARVDSGVLATAASVLLAAAVLALHPEPANALSVPTWMVHASSLLEWLVAMRLIFEHADTSGNPRWKVVYHLYQYML